MIGRHCDDEAAFVVDAAAAAVSFRATPSGYAFSLNKISLSTKKHNYRSKDPIQNAMKSENGSANNDAREESLARATVAEKVETATATATAAAEAAAATAAGDDGGDTAKGPVRIVESDGQQVSEKTHTRSRRSRRM
jgi:hypothetical protein